MAVTSAPPPPPELEVVNRHRNVVVAGHTGNLALVEAHMADHAPIVREAALSALQRLGACTVDHIISAMSDPAPRVRSRAGELAVQVANSSPAALLGDHDAAVVEVACFACGEMQWPSGTAPTEQLSQIATTHDDALCRESAAAALGAIGDPKGLEAVLVACNDRVTVRRRATLALAAFDDPRADIALQRALNDKDWQVRQAAEDLLEVGRVLDAPPDPDAYAD
ncbi:MAG: HEAT repeat domain-containing protein [Acidimicrobiaceae bacterium]|nr:HEAT repeat domain-containing protein [Acidimicrobiaceae bacterium]MDC1388932.1 HEAT repeat domain-containing protein [Acidimicrobiales bacterium]